MAADTSAFRHPRRQLDPLARGWGLLIALSLASALATVSGLPAKPAGLAVLALALIKARVILSRYLGLAAAPGWLTGSFAVLVLWALIAGGLFLI